MNLTRGGNVNLSKAAPSLQGIVVGLGWDARETGGATIHLDASAFLLNAGVKVRSIMDFIYYNTKSSPCGSVEHLSEIHTGAGDGDVEKFNVDLTKVPTDVNRISFCVTIHDAQTRRQNFGMVSRAFIRVIAPVNGFEIVRYDLLEDASIETAMIFGELYRNQGDWKFRAMGQGFAGGLESLAVTFGFDS